MKSKLVEYLLPVVIVVVAVALYFAMPSIQDFVVRISKGWSGGLILVGAGIFLGCYYAAVMGFRGKALGYAIFVIVFTCLCIWLFVNFDELFDWLRDTIGVWWTIAITLVMCAVFWVAMKLM